MALPSDARRYTYGDYLTWPDDLRCELIDGVVYDMSPAPLTDHQRLSRRLFRSIDAFLVGKPCEPFYAPVDVLLPKGREAVELVDTVVQPDIVVVCDASKVERRYIKGAPDVVVEILSPSTAVKDQRQKLAVYERAGVREYWVVHPTDRTVAVYALCEDGRYTRPAVYGANDSVPVAVLEGLTIDLAGVFGEVRDGAAE